MGRVSRTSPSKGLAWDSLVELSTSLSRVVAMLFSPANVFVLFLTDISCNIGLSCASTGTGSGSSVPFVGTSVEYRRLDDGVESCETSVVLSDSTPTLRVSNADGILSVPTPAAIGLGIGVERGEFIPAATVSGISWENGGLDDVVESCVIISVFIF